MALHIRPNLHYVSPRTFLNVFECSVDTYVCGSISLNLLLRNVVICLS